MAARSSPPDCFAGEARALIAAAVLNTLTPPPARPGVDHAAGSSMPRRCRWHELVSMAAAVLDTATLLLARAGVDRGGQILDSSLLPERLGADHGGVLDASTLSLA